MVMNILSRIQQHANGTPQRPVFIHREETLTYQELWEQSDALAAWLLEHFGTERRPVMVYGHKEAAMPICFLACVKAGLAYIPVDSSIPPERVRQILRQAQAQVLLSPTELPEELSSLPVPLVQGEDLRQILHAPPVRPVTPDDWVKESDHFYIIYTSGSTGEPKGVQIPASSLASFLEWMTRDFGLGEGHVFLNQAPLSFDLSVMDLYTAMVSGGTLWSVDREMIARPKLLFEGLQSSGIEVWVSTPSFAEFCLRERSFNQDLLPGLRTFLFCGETLANATAHELLRRFPHARIFNTYGPTEATVAVTAVEVTETLLHEPSPLPVGYVKPDCEIRILDEDGQTLGDGMLGEIVVIGPSVSTGYYRDEERTARSFFEVEGRRAYRTGDLGYRVNGLLFYKGRIDFQIKWQGYRIELEDIEENMRRLPGVRQVAVVPEYKEGRCESLTAFVVADREPEEAPFARAQEIKRELMNRLPTYMIPRRIVCVEQLPLTANGKVNRQALLREAEEVRR
jgi:D-alanine--poly(phosphoribitol) ligase subunit 1